MGSKTKVSEGAAAVATLEAELRAAEQAHKRQIVETHARLLRQKAEIEAIKHELEVLTSHGDPVGLDDMHRPIPRLAGGRPTISKHPFPHRVGNVRKWAEKNGVPWSSAKSWYVGKKPNPIPRSWAVLLERTYGIPAASWRGGITDRGHS